MLSQVEIEYCADTISAIASSRRVKEFIIGYTSNPRRRRSRYRLSGYQHFVILSAGMTREDALKLEKKLQDKVKTGDRRNLAYRKYCSERRALPHSASYGGIEGTPEAQVHSVYMVWWEGEWEE